MHIPDWLTLMILCYLFCVSSEWQINFFFLVSRQGKVRLAKWYDEFKTKGKERERIQREVTSLVLNRPQRMCNFVEWRDKKIVYKR